MTAEYRADLDQQALFGLAGDPPGHLLAAPIEHPCVVEPLHRLAARGFAVDWLPVTPRGHVDPAAVRDRVRPDTRLAVTIPTVDPQRGRLTGIVVQLLTLVLDPSGELRDVPHAEWSVRLVF